MLLVLHLHRDAPVAAWSERGWPALLTATAHPDVGRLFWAAHELTPATTARDLAVVDDLLTEIGALLDRIWKDAAEPGLQPELVVVSASLWAEMQRGRGAADLEHIATHSRLLRRLAGPDDLVRHPRPPGAVPAYVTADLRISGQFLSVVSVSLWPVTCPVIRSASGSSSLSPQR